ncbi:hypothetical protein ACLB2K_017819 [Fragaria x ananassa]
MSTGDHANKEDNLPPGFRFHPTDEELITYYLMNKISDATFTGRAIADVDLNKCEPWELPAKAKMGEKEWYFFSLRDRKYPTGVRTNRATNTGYWKTTGKDKEIFNSATSELVGMKKTLVFYRGRAPRGEKSNWVMHEYRIHSKSSFRPSKDEWIVCRVFQKSAGVKKYPPSNQSSSSSRGANPYNMELMGPSVNVVQSPIMQLGHEHQFPNYGRSYMTNAEMAELSRVLRGGGVATGSTSSPMNLPLLQPQFSYPNLGGGGFTISGLNLNLGGQSTQSNLRPMSGIHQAHQAMNNHQDVANSSMMTSAGGAVGQDQAGYGNIDMNNGNVPAGNRYMNMVDQCVDLDHYWPSY